MKFDKNMKIGITITTIVAVLFCYSLVGNNQLAQANQDTRGVSINLGVSDMLRVSDVLDYDTVLMSPTGAAAAKTFTFFASSTATDLVPTVGDMQDLCWHNATGTAATTNIFAAGTGMNLQTSSSTPTDLTIQAGNFMCMKFVREPDTDISVLMTEFEDAD